MSSYQERIIRAAKLESALYEEVEADETCLNQAMGVVVLSAVAGGIASIGQAGLGGIVVKVIVGLLSWYLWAYLTLFIGTRLLPEEQTESNYGEMLRTLGFAASPGLIQVVGVVPGLGTLITFAASLWMLVAMVIAVRQALDYTSTLRAVGVCIVGWLILVMINGILISLFAKSTI